MSRPSAQQLDQLYKQTLAASKRFASYNFREYFVRRTNERFTPLLSSSDTSGNVDASVDQKWWEKRVQELDVLKRAGEVNRTFQGPKMVIEHARPITGESIWSFPNRWSLRSVLMILLFFFDDLLVYSRWWRGRRSQSLELSRTITTLSLSSLSSTIHLYLSHYLKPNLRPEDME